MTRKSSLSAAALFALALTPLFATPPPTAKRNVPPDLAKQAKVTLEAARATALAKVPGGVVKSEELEREHGKLIYSFDIAVAHRAGIEEVNVSAISGKVVAQAHESAQDEKREKREESLSASHPPHA